MNNIDKNQSVGEIVALYPKASEVFKKYKIDFCCGGKKLLIDVIKEQNLNEEEVMNSLNETLQKADSVSTEIVDFKKMSPGSLIDHIVSTHHVYVKKTLPELSELSLKILRVHGMNHQVLFRVHKMFSALKAELEQHLLKEEELLFPLIVEYEFAPSEKLLDRIFEVIKEIEDEHEAAGDVIKELRLITDDFKVPDDGCTTYDMTFKMFEELEADLFQHIHLENNILFVNLGYV
ncbi:MAG: iron-sulfur cluster repair di-iron protein [Saccharofermentanales bacterium]